jgi:hypothetical protein
MKTCARGLVAVSRREEEYGNENENEEGEYGGGIGGVLGLYSGCTAVPPSQGRVYRGILILRPSH